MPTLSQLPSSDARLRTARAAFGLLGAAAILYQLKVGLDQPHPEILNFFSFFTIQSNILFAAVLLAGALKPGSGRARAAVRGAATLYMLITGIVYWTLLQWTGAELGLTAPWVNLVLHGVLPLVAIADWVLAPPGAALSRATAMRWLLYPVLFFAYSMVRGYLVVWYPYPFLNPGLHSGYSGVLFTAAILIVLIAALALGVRAAGDRSRAAPPARV